MKATIRSGKSGKNPRTFRRVHRWRHLDGFYHIRAFIEERMLSGIAQAKDLKDMRARMFALSKNDRFWKAMADLDNTVAELKSSL